MLRGHLHLAWIGGNLMRIAAVAVLLASVSRAAFADVFVGIEHSVSPSVLKAIASAIERAGARPDDQQEFPLYLSIQDRLMLNCPAHKPDAAGNGCFLFVLPTNPVDRGEVSVSLRKPIFKSLLDRTAAEASDKIASVDPNATEDHLQFGNPLYTIPSGVIDGTHYYCAPEGHVGKREWKCFLSVSEMLAGPTLP